MNEELSFSDLALCFNCRNYDPEQKQCLVYNLRPKNPQDTCAAFEQGTSYTYEEWKKVRETLKQKQEIPKTPTKKLGETLKNGVPEIKWRVEQMVPERGVIILGGASGSYKTFAAQDLALSVSTGRDFLTQYPSKQCPVLYIDEENGDITLYSRFSELSKGREISHEELNNINVSIFNNIKLDTKNSGLILKSLIESTNARLIILDSMVRLMEGEEDKARDVRRIFETIKDVLNDYEDVSFLILHHTAKAVRNGLNSLRGSGDFAAFADVVLIFDGKKGYALVEVVKNRHVDLNETKPFLVKLVEEGVGKKLIWVPQDELAGLIRQCADFIKDWFEDSKIKIFQTKQARQEAEKEGFKYNTIASALKLLVSEGDLSKQKQGTYKVCGVVLSEETLD